MKKTNNIISDWLEKYGDPEMEKQVEEEIEYINKIMEIEVTSENNTTEYLDCLSSLKKVNNGIHRQEVVLWFNENDIDYFNMTDLDMYIYYIEKTNN